MRRATANDLPINFSYAFQSTLSMRRATRTRKARIETCTVFQSTLSMRRATVRIPCSRSAGEFQSTLSMRRATGRLGIPYRHRMISIHALHEESDLPHMPIKRPSNISIHALHEESDGNLIDRGFNTDISIHALHEESDNLSVVEFGERTFQSTLSMRRATSSLRPLLLNAWNFNPRSP